MASRQRGGYIFMPNWSYVLVMYLDMSKISNFAWTSLTDSYLWVAIFSHLHLKMKTFIKSDPQTCHHRIHNKDFIIRLITCFILMWKEFLYAFLMNWQLTCGSVSFQMSLFLVDSYNLLNYFPCFCFTKLCFCIWKIGLAIVFSK